jgi:hypothetical protein
MSADDDPQQVSLDGTDATRYVAAERDLLDRARRVAHLAANAAVDGDLDADPEGEKPVYIHRLAAWVWGVLESPFFTEDPREVHHHTLADWVGSDPIPKGGIPWFTAEDHLTAERPDEHAEHHFRGGSE